MYENAEYRINALTGEICGIACTRNGALTFVPIGNDNSFYLEMMELVKQGKLTIKPLVTPPVIVSSNQPIGPISNWPSRIANTGH